MSQPRSIHEADSHSTPHVSHDAEALHTSEDGLHDDWTEPKNLDAPPPREGFAQRWVRYATHDGEDLINVQTMMRKGWRPRAVESIPQAFKTFPTTSHASMGDVFAVGGMVLCEMPEQLAMRIRRATRQRTQSLNLAVTDETDRASRIGEARGYARIQRKERVSATGRRPALQAD